MLIMINEQKSLNNNGYLDFFFENHFLLEEKCDIIEAVALKERNGVDGNKDSGVDKTRI